MTTYSNDPVRCRLTLDDVWNMTHPAGINSTFYPTDSTETEFYCKLNASDISPHNPIEEKYKEDIEREMEKLPIIQDHIREFKPYTYFNNCKSRTIETVLDEKVFSKDNRYDVLLDRIKNPHKLPDGRLFGIIEDG